MIIIPELKTVLLQPPRTGTTAVRDAVLAKYPKSFLLYRHMESDGIPFGYAHWHKVAQVRHPVDRLMSVFKYMREPIVKERTKLEWRARMMRATENGFDAWLQNKEIFTSSMLPSGPDFRPRDAVKWSYPEQVKSQALWARDAELIMFENLEADALSQLGVEIEHKNQSAPYNVDYDLDNLISFIRLHHEWDCDLYGLDTNQKEKT